MSLERIAELEKGKKFQLGATVFMGAITVGCGAYGLSETDTVAVFSYGASALSGVFTGGLGWGYYVMHQEIKKFEGEINE